jgi:hypothetical protein
MTRLGSERCEAAEDKADGKDEQCRSNGVPHLVRPEKPAMHRLWIGFGGRTSSRV